MLWTSENILDMHAKLVLCISKINEAYELSHIRTDDMLSLSEMRSQCDALKRICAEKIISSNSLDDESFASMFSSVPIFLKTVETSLSIAFRREIVL